MDSHNLLLNQTRPNAHVSPPYQTSFSFDRPNTSLRRVPTQFARSCSTFALFCSFLPLRPSLTGPVANHCLTRLRRRRHRRGRSFKGPQDAERDGPNDGPWQRPNTQFILCWLPLVFLLLCFSLCAPPFLFLFLLCTSKFRDDFLDDGKKRPDLDLQAATTHSLHQTATHPSANTLIKFTKINRRHQ